MKWGEEEYPLAAVFYRPSGVAVDTDRPRLAVDVLIHRGYQSCTIFCYDCTKTDHASGQTQTADVQEEWTYQKDGYVWNDAEKKNQLTVDGLLYVRAVQGAGAGEQYQG